MIAKKKQPAKRVKAGQSKLSTAERRAVFVEAFLSNGGNALQAAISAGFSEKTAGSQGSRLLKNVEVSTLINSRRTELVAKIELSTERTLREVGRLAYADPRRIMHEDGRIKMPHELDEETAAAISSFEVSFDGSIKYKFWDKNSALDRACKIIGAFERDNKQKTDALQDLIAGLGGNVLGVTKDAD